jgi:hypothetical protein
MPLTEQEPISDLLRDILELLPRIEEKLDRVLAAGGDREARNDAAADRLTGAMFCRACARRVFDRHHDDPCPFCGEPV